MFRNLSVSFFCLLTPVSFCGVKRIFHLSFGQLSLGGITAQIALAEAIIVAKASHKWITSRDEKSAGMM
jgi:chromate transport protein ChrA